MNISIKQCRTCKQELPIERFVKNIRSKDGHHYVCKGCVKEYQLANKEKLKAYQHEYQKIYYVENKEKLYENARKWQKANPEKHRAIVKKSNSRPERKEKFNEYRRIYDKQARLRKKLEQNHE